MLVGRRAGRLDNENIAAANIFFDFDVGLAVGKGADQCLPERHSQVIANALGQLAVRRAGEHLHLWLKCEHERGANLGAKRHRWQRENAREHARIALHKI